MSSSISAKLPYDYRLVELLGEGGMGAVYRAEHTLLSKRTVALKMLHAFLTNHQEITQRFLNEALAASILESEHIVKVVDCQQDPRIGAWWIAMEHLRGQTLARYLASQGQALSVQTATRILSQVAEALDEAHAHGIVHRDIKPENIFLVERADTREFVKVLDFGIAKLRRDDAGVVTRTGASLGTTPYMPPSRFAAGRSIIASTCSHWPSSSTGRSRTESTRSSSERRSINSIS